jgi:hypothetical protein
MFGSRLKVGVVSKYSDIDFYGAVPWVIPDTNKSTLEWSLRIFRDYTRDGWAVKIDPDTVVKSVPEAPPQGHDAAGDFRFISGRWIWFGGFQLFTKKAAEVVSTSEPVSCVYQDVELAKILSRSKLACYNYGADEVDCWSSDKTKSAGVWHRGLGVGHEPKDTVLLF